MISLDRSSLPRALRVGTSSFSSPDWCGSFYPDHMSPGEFLGYYSTRFNTVEIDATWHAMPSRRTVEAWASKVPEGFTFSMKVPKVITHDRSLEGCGEEWNRFLQLVDLLGDKKGPILFQFPYLARGQNAEEYRTGNDFRRRLQSFLSLIPREGRFVIEVRNRTWLGEPLLDLLRSRGLALALIDYYTMPRADEIRRDIDPVTADFAYIRFLGDHKSMDHQVARARDTGKRRSDWGELLTDRATETRAWIATIRELLGRLPEVYAYFNNHYAGFAPGSIELFLKLWKETAEETKGSAQ
jgi:uncharacterized protein YecE (DUF72 family)